MSDGVITICLKKLCRTCSQESEELLSLLNLNFSDDVRVVDFLESCGFLKVRENDGLPLNICRQCCILVQQIYNFRIQCQTSDIKIRLFLSMVRTPVINDSAVNTEMYIPDVNKNCPTVFNEEEQLNTHNLHCGQKKDQELNGCKDSCNEVMSNMVVSDPSSQNSSLKCPTGFEKEKQPNAHSEHRAASDQRENRELDGYDKPYKDTDSNVAIRNRDVNSSLKVWKCTYICLECKQKFTSISDLHRHRKLHTVSEETFECLECNEMFAELADYKEHTRSHTRKKSYLCATCGQMFTRSSHLNVHMRTHTGERPYLCRDCGRKFTQGSTLRTHERTHTGVRPYVCHICSKGFKQKSGLTAHINTHSINKLYVCPTCPRAFSQSSSLNRHLKSHSQTLD